MSAPGRSAGFSLLEAVVALLIMGTALVATLEAVSGGLRAQQRSRRHVEAVGLAEARMNELAALPTDSLHRFFRERRGRFAPPFDRFSWRARMRPADGDPALLETAVRVIWSDGAYDLETILYRPDRIPEALRGDARR